MTGKSDGFGEKELQYFNRIANLNLNNPQIIGFGINSKDSFTSAVKHQKGAIIGSAFINFIRLNTIKGIPLFINNLL